MTAETVTTTSTAVEPYIAQGTLVLKKGASLKEVADEIADPLPDLTGYTETLPFPALPSPVTITPEVEAAIKALPEVFNKVEPTERRSLSATEIVAIREEQKCLRAITELLITRDENLKEYVRNHMDVDAEERGVAVPKAVVRGGKTIVEATPRSADGHYILAAKGSPERCPIPGTNEEYSREFRNGTLSIDGSKIEEMYEAGEITREDYLAMTRERRVFDEEKARKALLDNPSRLRILKKITSRSKPGTSLFVRKAK